MSDRPSTIRREQLAAFVGDQRALRALEQILKQVGVEQPTQIAELVTSIAEAMLYIDSASTHRVAQQIPQERPTPPQFSRSDVQQLAMRVDALEGALRSSRAAEASLRAEIEDLKQMIT